MYICLFRESARYVQDAMLFAFGVTVGRVGVEKAMGDRAWDGPSGNVV